MKKGILTNNFWGMLKGSIVYVDFCNKLHNKAIGIYDNNKKFIVYLFDTFLIDENIQFI